MTTHANYKLEKYKAKVYQWVIGCHSFLRMSVPVINDFFRERRSFTEVKQEVFGKYFDAWCDACLRRLKDAIDREYVFVDLLAVTNPESLSDDDTYLHKSLIKRPLLNQKLRTYTYTKYNPLQESIKGRLEALPYLQDLIHPPLVLSNPESKAVMVESIEASNQPLAFLDPFQNKFTQQFLQQAVTIWGTDLFMMLHPENITKAVTGKKVSQPIRDLFGDTTLDKINTYCRKEKDKARQQDFILNQFIEVLQANGNFTLLFKANPPQTEQADCYLLFSSPDCHAYRLFKETILNYSTYQEDGVADFMANTFPKPQLVLFEQLPDFTIAKLQERILEKASLYKYKSIEAMYEMDAVGTNYSKENYLTAVELLRKAGKLELMNSKTMQIIRQPVLSAIVKYKV